MLVPDDVPHIEACCADCGFMFDLKFTTDCPACHHTGVRYARLVTEEEAKERYGEVASKRLSTALDRITDWQAGKDYPGRLCSPYTHTEGDHKDIAELDRLYALEDKREGD